MAESASLALLPLIAALLVMTARFYVREGAMSILSPSFMLATLAVLMLTTYLVLVVIGLLPPYAWIGFGGIGLAIALGGIWSFYR